MQTIILALLGLLDYSAHACSSTALSRLLAGALTVSADRGAAGPNTRLVVDSDIAKRVRQTMSRDLLLLFDECVRHRAVVDDHEWHQISTECDELGAELHRLVRNGSPQLARPAIDAFEIQHSCELQFVDAGDVAKFAQELSLTLARTVETWSEIARGRKTATEAMAETGPLVPLSTVWGRTIGACLDARLAGRTHRYSATKKLQLVAGEIASVLGRTPVECMQPSHVAQYIERLHCNGNKVGTIENKLGVLASLVSGIAPSATLDELKRKRPNRKAIEVLRTKRRPMSQFELGAFLHAIFVDTSLHPDDRIVVALTALTSARIDEIASLRASDIKWDGDVWSLSITLADDERAALLKWLPQGFSFPGLKGVESKRTIPVCASVIPGLHERLMELVGRPACVFTHLGTTSAGRKGSSIGQRINRRMKVLFGPRTDLVFESLRNTASPTLRRAGVNLDLRRAHLGHAPIDIHARHYDEVSFDDLKGGARVIADFVAHALQGKEFPRLDVHFCKCRRVLKRKPAMLHENCEAGAVQDCTLDVHKTKAVSRAPLRLLPTSREVAAGSVPALRIVQGVHPHLHPDLAA